MRYFFLVFTLCVSTFCFAQKKVSIILDTDIAPDYDDVGAMALLHAFADAGEAEILATISCNVFETTAPTLSLLNTYFNRPGIPIGITKADKPNYDCKQKWAQGIVSKYPHALKSNGEAVDAVQLYRKILASRPDNSVTIVTVGFFTNLANLLSSGADEFSTLNGKALVAKKVKQLVSMAAGIGKDGKSFREYNVWVDAPASQKVFTEWPTPFTVSGFEIGHKIITGASLVANASIQNSPVKDAFQIALDFDKTPGRHSWDQTAVLVAVKGIDPYFSSRKVNIAIQDDGTDVVSPGDRFTYLVEKMPPEEVARVIEKLMMHQPVKK